MLDYPSLSRTVKLSVKYIDIFLVGGINTEDGASTSAMQSVVSATSYDPADVNQTCSRLHDVAVLNRLVEVYEKIDCEISPGIHGVRYVSQ